MTNTNTKRGPVPRERRELFAAASVAECEAWEGFDATLHEIVFDAGTRIASVYRRRKPANRTIRTAITRELKKPFKHYKRALVISLLPTDEIRFRLKGCRDAVQVDIEKLYQVALQWRAFRLMAEKRAARAAKRRARKAEGAA